MLADTSLYLKVADWPLILVLSTVITLDFFAPSQLPKTPVFTPPTSMKVIGAELVPIELVLTANGSPLCVVVKTCLPFDWKSTTLTLYPVGLTVSLPLWLNMSDVKLPMRFCIPAVPSASGAPFLVNAS